MTIKINAALTSLLDACNPRQRYTTHLIRAIAVALGATLLAILLLLSVGKFRFSNTGRHIFFILTYCTAIALPSIAILTRVSQLYSDRFPRLIVLVQALILVCTATAGSFVADAIFQVTGALPRGEFWIEFRGSLLFSIIISLIVGLSMSTYETLQFRLRTTALELRARQAEQERAYKLLAEARLSSLESRIHPHFLFNTLNSISALIPTDPQRAEDTVGKLASLLRFSLNANQSGLVPLGQELKIVRDYLEIEKTRFGPRIRYEIAVPESLHDVRVPPLALQSLVENAVKHVAAQRPQGASIEISGSRITDPGSAKRICLEVLDDGPGFSLGAIDPDHGLGNLMARLELLFGTAGQLEVARKDNKTAVQLTFPG